MQAHVAHAAVEPVVVLLAALAAVLNALALIAESPIAAPTAFAPVAAALVAVALFAAAPAAVLNTFAPVVFAQADILV